MRKTFVALALVLLALTQGPGVAAASGTVPDGSNAFGASRTQWAKAYSEWLLGDASNPAVSDSCGAIVDGAFFLNAALGPGTEFDCAIPRGTPMVLSHAAYYAWVPTDGSNDAEIVEAARTFFGHPASSLTLDGRALPLRITETGAFDVISEPGSAYDVLFGLGTGPVRTATVGQFTVLHPLSVGGHQIVGIVDYTASGGPVIDVTYNITVR